MCDTPPDRVWNHAGMAHEVTNQPPPLVDHDVAADAALLEGRPQQLTRNPGGQFRLFRIGDAVSSRNIHAAVFDALRLLKDV